MKLDGYLVTKFKYLDATIYELIIDLTRRWSHKYDKQRWQNE